MAFFSKITDIVRSPGDPKVIQTGPSSRALPDRLAQKLGWFSIGLGLVEVLAARGVARSLGLRHGAGLIRAFGVREIFAGMMCLSTESKLGVWSRVGGDALDFAALFFANGRNNPKKRNVDLAMAAVAGITLLDVITAEGLTARHRRGQNSYRDYSDRPGLDPKFFKRSI
jgi:hypothetical protein